MRVYASIISIAILAQVPVPGTCLYGCGPLGAGPGIGGLGLSTDAIWLWMHAVAFTYLVCVTCRF